MKGNLLLFFICLLLSSASLSQDSLTARINRVYDNQPDHILMNTDRDYYVPGDTIWYSTKIMAGHSPSITSTVLYTELWDSRGQLVSEQTQPIRQAHSEGMLAISRDAVGPLLLRAYTAGKQESGEQFLFLRTIALFSPGEKKILTAANNNNNQVSAPTEPTSIQANTGKDFAFFTLLRDDNKPPPDTYTLAAFLNRQLIFKAPADLRQESVLGGRIPLPASGSGRLEILLIDKALNLQGYQVMTTGNDDPLQKMKIIAANDNKKETPYIEISWADSTAIQLSVSITPAALQAATDQAETEANKAFWKNALKSELKSPDNAAGTFIRWTAELSSSLTKRYKNKPLIILVKAPGQELQYHDVQVSDAGKIELDGLQYYDSASVYIMEPGKKGISPLSLKDITITDNLLHRNNKPSPPSLPFPPVTIAPENMSRANDILEAHADYKSANNLVELTGVTVAAKKKEERELLDKRYSTGPFTREDGARIILPEDDPAFLTSLNILHYLDGRIPGMQVDRDAMENAISWRSGYTSIFIDEMHQLLPHPDGNGVVEDARRLAATPMSDVAMIKIFSPPFIGSWGNGPGGAIAVYLKKREDRIGSLPPAKPIARGFSAPALFKNMPDRTSPTIYWNSQIIFQGKQTVARIPLPKEWRGQQVRVQVLGMESNGQILRKELILTSP